MQNQGRNTKIGASVWDIRLNYRPSPIRNRPTLLDFMFGVSVTARLNSNNLTEPRCYCQVQTEYCVMKVLVRQIDWFARATLTFQRSSGSMIQFKIQSHFIVVQIRYNHYIRKNLLVSHQYAYRLIFVQVTYYKKHTNKNLTYKGLDVFGYFLGGSKKSRSLFFSLPCWK